MVATPTQQPAGITGEHELLEEAQALAAMGLRIIPVIPEALPAEKWPQRYSNGEPKVDKTGRLLPAFVGKNPSCWRCNGEPQLLSHKRPGTVTDTIARFRDAIRAGHPIGLAIIPSTEVVVIDFDAKNYPGGTAELEADYRRLVAAYPELARSRTERTPGGGIHLYVRVADAMASWEKPSCNGKVSHYCHFATTPDGPSRGEVLTGTRVSVTAPTTSSRGAYALLEGTESYAHQLVEVPSLEAIGIHAVGRKASPQAPLLEAAVPPTTQEVLAAGELEPPELRRLLRRHAQAVLRGEQPYGDDRSSNLAGFLRELWGCLNFLETEGLPWRGDSSALEAEAVAALDIKDKATRVAESIDRSACAWGKDRTAALGLYQSVAGQPPATGRSDRNRSRRSDQSQDDKAPAAAPEAKPAGRKVLTLPLIQERIRHALEEGYSQADLATLVAELAQESGHPATTIREILRAIEKEVAAATSIKAEALSIRAEADRREVGQSLTLAALFPPSIADALQIRCQALPADDVAAAVTFMVGVSGLAKIGTRVVASEVSDFKPPVNLYAALVARSGAKKSPVSRLLVKAPTHELRLELAQEHHRAMTAWQEACRGKKPAERPTPPRALHLQVSDTTAEALASQLEVQEARGMGMLLHRDELAGLFGSLNAYRSGRGADEEMLLEAYDGTGFQSLRVATAGGGRFYDRCHLSVWGTIQPAVLQSLVAEGDASGLWARFLFVPLPERVVPLPESESEAEQRAAAAAARTLADACRAVYLRAPADLRLSRDAWQAFRLYEANRQGDALRVTIQAQQALYGKAPGKALRIAGLLHLLQLVALDGTAEAEISATMMDKAIRLVDHLNAWALSFHADLSSSGTYDLMRLVHRAATAAGCPVRWVQIRDLLSKGRRQEVDSAAVAAAMTALAELGVGEVEVGPRGGSRYRATKSLP